MCNKKAQLGQKAKVADGREKSERKEKGNFLKRNNKRGEVKV